MRCSNCGKDMHSLQGSYRYTESGLPVLLHGVTLWRCEPCGLEKPVIPNIVGLHLTIGLALAKKRSPLVPAEITFLRKVLGLTMTRFARLLGVTKASISEWESGTKTPGLANDKNLRRAYVLKVLEMKDGRLVALDEINAAIERVSGQEPRSLLSVELRYSAGVAPFSEEPAAPPSWEPLATVTR